MKIYPAKVVDLDQKFNPKYEITYKGKRIWFYRPPASATIEILYDNGSIQKVYELDYLGEKIIVSLNGGVITHPVQKRRTHIDPEERKAILTMLQEGESIKNVMQRYPNYPYNCITQMKYRLKHP